MADIDIEEVLQQILGGNSPTGRRGNSRSGRSGSSRGSPRIGQPVLPNVGDLDSRTQYRYQLAQTASQSGAGEEIVGIITNAPDEQLPAIQEALMGDNPGQDIFELANNPGFAARNIGAPGASVVNRTFHELGRPLNAVTGALTEILRDNPDGNPLEWLGGVLESGGRGLWRGADYDQHYGTNAVLDEIENYNIAGHDIPVPDSGIPRAVANFAGDVILDPLVYTRTGTGGTENVVTGTVRDARRAVNAASDEFADDLLRNIDTNSAGPILERMIDDQYRATVRQPVGARRRGQLAVGDEGREAIPIGGQFRRPSLDEVLRRQGAAVYDPVSNRIIPRPSFPEVKPKRFAAKRKVAEQMSEEDFLNNLAHGTTRTQRADNYVRNASEIARQGYFRLEFAGHELLGNNKLTRALYTPIGTARFQLGYTSQLEPRLLNRMFSSKSSNPGALEASLRRAEGNYASMTQATLHDVSRIYRHLDEPEFLRVFNALDQLKHLPDDDALTAFFNNIDQIPTNGARSTTFRNKTGDWETQELLTLGDNARVMATLFSNIRMNEVAHGLVDPSKFNEVIPLFYKNGRRVEENLRHLSYEELKRQGKNMMDPLNTIAEGIAYRMQRLASAEASMKGLNESLITVVDPRAKFRKVRNTKTGKMMSATSQEAQDLSVVARGDLDPVSQALLGGPVIDDTARALTIPEDGLDLDLADLIAAQGNRGGIVRQGSLEFVPIQSIDNPAVKAYLKGVDLKAGQRHYVPKPVADALNRWGKLVLNDEEFTTFVRGYDKILGKWKKAATVYNPGYHARNMFSDYFMNVAAGVHNPHVYDQALRVLKARWKHEGDLAAGLLDTPLRQVPSYLKARPQYIKVNDELVRSDNLWDLYANFSGAKSGQIRAEVTSQAHMAEVSKRRGMDPRRAASGLTNFSESREDMMRLAHFIHRYTKEAKKRGITTVVNGRLTGEARKLSEEVGDIVRQYNIDYNAKSLFERKVAARVIPFYTFLRKNLQLQTQLLLTRPGTIANYPKYQELFQGLIGSPQEDDSLTLVPQWVRESYPWLIETESRRARSPMAQLLNMFGMSDEQGAVVMPMQDVLPVGTLNFLNPALAPITEGRLPQMSDVSDMTREVVSSMTPALKIPVEVATGRSMFTGQEFRDPGDWENWLAGLVPQGRVGYGLSPLSDNPDSSQDDLMRWLTGIPLRQITPSMEQGEFRRRQDVLDVARRRSRDSINEELAELGLDPIDSLPGADPEELIAMILEGARRRGRG